MIKIIYGKVDPFMYSIGVLWVFFSSYFPQSHFTNPVFHLPIWFYVDLNTHILRKTYHTQAMVFMPNVCAFLMILVMWEWGKRWGEQNFSFSNLNLPSSSSHSIFVSYIYINNWTFDGCEKKNFFPHMNSYSLSIANIHRILFDYYIIEVC